MNQRIFRNIRTTELACSQWTSELIPGGDLGEKGPSQAPVFGHQLVMLFRGVMGALLENMNSWGRVLCVYSPTHFPFHFLCVDERVTSQLPSPAVVLLWTVAMIFLLWWTQFLWNKKKNKTNLFLL